MSVRRLAEKQPESFAFTPENLAWAKKEIEKFPAGRQSSAVIPILWRVQEQEGWVSEPAIRTVAELLDMPNIRVLEIATFYTMFLLAPVGKKAHIQVCGTTPCMLRGAGDLIATCRKRIHPQPLHVSEDGNLSWEEVECLGACVNAPIVQIVPDTYEDLTVESFNRLIDDIEAGRPLKPGPQVDRWHSAPAGEQLALTSPELYDGSMIGKGAGLAAAREAIAARAAAAANPAPAAAAPAPAPAAASAPPPAAPAVSAAAGNPPAPPPSDPAPAKPPVAEAVKVQGEADHERVPDTAKPELLRSAREGKGDDLKLIWGVGPKLEELLHSLGIFHFDQIAAWTVDNLKWIDQNLEGFRGRAIRDKWVEQAGKLATGWRPSAADGDKPN